MTDDEYISIAEAQSILGVSRPRMTQILREGLLSAKPNPVDRRSKLVRRRNVEALARQPNLGTTARVRLPEIALTEGDFERLDWEGIIADVEPHVCECFSSRLYAKIDEAEAAGDLQTAAAYWLLGALASLMLRPEKQPALVPVAVFTTGRSFALEDVSDNQWRVLEALAPNVTDPEMQARIADALWEGKRSHAKARLAIEAYLQSARRLEGPKDWVYPCARIERALRLALRLNDGAAKVKVVEYIESLLDSFGGEDPLYFSLKLIELMLESKLGDPQRYARLAEAIAHRAESEGYWDRAETAWQVAAASNQRGEQTEQARATQLAAAETYIKAAEEAAHASPPDYFRASISIRNAIEALRRLAGTKQQVEELQARLQIFQERSLESMHQVPFELNVADMASHAEAAVTSKSLEDALRALALLGGIPPVKTLRELVEEQARKYPLSHLIPAMVVSDSGTVSGQRPGAPADNTDEAEAFMRAEMFQRARMYQLVHALGFVEPARQRITLEHVVRLADILPLVLNNPFVPVGRELIFAKGILAGLEGDFVVAASLLIPQVENSLRYVLERRGVLVRKYDQKGIQDVLDLNALFYERKSELETLFGEDLCFDLQGLLIERFGSDLRNESAHGLLSYEQLQSVQSEYFWWLTIHICVVVQLLISA